jgi:choline dehydrogenase
MHMAESFDYIIVGAGSAGCVLAHRLSENPHTRVLLIEAGGKDNKLHIHIPAGMLKAVTTEEIHWPYQSEPEPRLNHRRFMQQRGKVLGGSSSINSMAYMRGNAMDYDNWVHMGAEGWSYAEVLPYFRKSETFDGGSDSYRGDTGPLGVRRATFPGPLFETFIEAGLEAGYPRSADLNGYQQEGFGPADATIRNGRRSSTARAYLQPVLQRPNLEVRTNAFVNRIAIENGRARGIVIESAGGSHEVIAEREVILCAGAINSPQLLMLSGIGPGAQLQEHGIGVKRELPGVGANLMDHLCVNLQWECTQPVSMLPYTRFPRRWLAGLQWLLFKTGAAATTHGEAAGFLRSRPGIQWPDVQIHFYPVCALDDLTIAPVAHGFLGRLGPLRPRSRGRIELGSSDPHQAPKIHFNYLAFDEDWEDMRTSVALTREIFRQPAFDAYRGQEIVPGENANTVESIDTFIRETAGSNYHVCGTCKMGIDDMAVVDPACRVHGIQGLRVVDASVMPQITSGNTNGPTIMIGEKAADHIKGKLEPAAPVESYVAEDWEATQRPGKSARSGLGESPG